MAAVRSDRIGIPTGLHERRVLAWLRSSAGDALAGRRVWCAASRSGGQVAGRRLRDLLKGDLEIDSLAVEADESLAQLAEPNLGERVRPGDVVVFHDRFTVSFAAALRDRGVHAVWHLHGRSGLPAPGVEAAVDFLDRSAAAALDAVVFDERVGTGGPERVTALIPASRLLDIREVPLGRDAARARRQALAWISLLGDIVEEDRADHVGGTIQARPVVAAR
ncbi:MAG TPA: hypothetical protein VG816_12515 [Solirubrobacterales bacterium]|nr:hypothetical protein [Solirubrobacterales bacterium]